MKETRLAVPMVEVLRRPAPAYVAPPFDAVPIELRGHEAVIACEGECRERLRSHANGKPLDVRSLFSRHEFVRRESGALGDDSSLRGRVACVRHLYRCQRCGGVRVYGCE